MKGEAERRLDGTQAQPRPQNSGAVRRSRFVSVERMAERYWRLVVIAMLGCLHIAALVGVENLWGRGLMMAHLGLFLVWQPFIQVGQRLKLREIAFIALTAVVILGFLNWWIIGLWVAVLSGIVGGKVFLFQARWLRMFYLTVFSYLVALLLLWIVPNGFPNAPLQQEIAILAQYGLPMLFAAMLVMPMESDTAEPQIVDFFYSSMIFLLLVALVLGSFAFMTTGRNNYALSLTYSLLVIGGVLVFLSLVWNPRAGFAGLQMVFSRYLLSIGLPFEQWLHFLADLSRSEPRPERFLREACIALGKLPWVTGGSWTTSADTGDFGVPSKHTVEYVGRDVSIRLHSRQRPSPSLVWHFHLLGQLLGQFYVAKQREVKLQQQTYLQALYEAGARMTHDIKNLLQSLNVLCSAAEREPDGDPAALQSLMRRHLPTVLQRLQHTLDKLQRPQMDSGRFAYADAWWESLQKSLHLRGVQFEVRGLAPGILLPKDLFDSAADNMVQNALEKRKLNPDITVMVTLDCTEHIALRVCDSGRPIAPDVLAGLLKGPVSSETGYGIGLYQVARQADAAGFRFFVADNEPGRVCFELRGEIRHRDPAARSTTQAASS